MYSEYSEKESLPSTSGDSFNNSHVPMDEANAVIEQLTNRVEKFKTRTLLLQAEQDNLLMALAHAKDKYSIYSEYGGSLIISFLIQNLSGVDIKISTVRNVQEDEALHQINSLIDQLICKVHDDEREKKTVCNNYIKLCNSGKNLCTNSAQNFTTVSSTGICVEMSENCETSVGGDFYSLITKCTVDDQHRVRMRLAGLRDYIESQEKALKQPADVCSE